MAGGNEPRQRYGEALWRAYHEAWKRSELNQREYCEAQGISLKAFNDNSYLHLTVQLAEL